MSTDRGQFIELWYSEAEFRLIQAEKIRNIPSMGRARMIDLVWEEIQQDPRRHRLNAAGEIEVLMNVWVEDQVSSEGEELEGHDELHDHDHASRGDHASGAESARAAQASRDGSARGEAWSAPPPYPAPPPPAGNAETPRFAPPRPGAAWTAATSNSAASTMK